MRGHFAVGFKSREEGGEGREQCVVGALERARAQVPPRVT